jgi:hypothetical protein
MHRCRPLLCTLLLAIGLAAGAAHAEEEPPAWKPDEVARVLDDSVTWLELCRAAVEHLTPALRVRESTASSVLQRVVTEHVTSRACRERGIAATAEDVARRRAELDASVKKRTGGRQTLDDILMAQVVSRRALEARLRGDLHAKALAAAGADVAQLVGEAEIRVFAPNAAYPSARSADGDVFLIVDGVPVGVVDFGARLLANIGAGRVRAILDAECRSRLAALQGARLSEEDMAEEIRFLADLQALEERFDPEEVWETVYLHGDRKERHARQPEELPESPHARSLFGLVKRYREAATAEDVRRAWEAKRDSTYGPHVRVTDVRIEYRRASDVFGGGPKRTRSEALRLARSYLAEIDAGLSFDALVRRIQEAAEPGVTAERLRLYQTDRSRILLDRALAVRDGEVAPLFETLSEVHLLRREAAEEAPAFETIEKLVRERLARERVRNWFEDMMADQDSVRLRWPLPLMP